MSNNSLITKISKIDWWLAGICASRCFSGFVFLTYAAALPVLQREWNMTAAAGGSISSGYNIGYAVSLVVFSSLADIVGPKKLYLGSMTLGGFFSMAFAVFARDYLSCLVLYTLVGISLGGTYTTGVMLLADQYPPERRGTAMGFFIASTSMGYAMSLALSGAALPIGGYKLSFFLTCLGPAAAAVVTWITLFKTEVRVVRREKKQKFTREVLGNRKAMILIVGYMFHSWELLGMRSWTPAFIAGCLVCGGTSGLNAAGVSSYINALVHLTGLFAAFSMGMLSDRLGRARVLFMVALTSAVISLVFGWTSGLPVILVALLGMSYNFFLLGDSPVLSAALTEEVDPAFLGSALGLRSLLGFGMGAASPLVFGAVLDWTNPGASAGHYGAWGWAYMVLGAGGLISSWCAHTYGKIRRRERIAG